MRFKIDENLKRVAAAKAARPETVAVELCDAIIKAGMIPRLSDVSVQNAMCKQSVFRVASILSDYLGINIIPSDVFDAFCNLIFIDYAN